MMRPLSLSRLVLSQLVLFGAVVAPASAEQTQAVQAISFVRQIEPLLRRNCVACHRDQQSEGGLSLESESAFQRGGDSGPLLAPTDADESLLYQRIMSADDPMPPLDNTVGADRLNEQETELIKRWISEGAMIDSFANPTAIDWQPIPESLRSSYALAVSPGDRFIAIARANRVDLVDANTGQTLSRLVDERLGSGSAADVDLIQAVAVSPLGDRIATGGFRAVRIWKRSSTPPQMPPQLKHAAGTFAFNPDHSAVAIVTAISDVEIWEMESNQLRCTLPNAGAVSQIVWRNDSEILIGHSSGDLNLYDPHSASLLASLTLDHVAVQVDQSVDGRRIVTLGSDGTVRLFTDRQLHALQSISGIADARCVACGPSDTLIVGSESGSVKVIEIATDQVRLDLAQGSPVTSITTNHAENVLATGGGDGKTLLWNVADGTLMHTCNGDATAQLRLASLQDDANRERSWIESLKSKTAELNKALENEDAALAKVNEAKQKASSALNEVIKQRDDTLTQIASTEQSIAQTKSQIDSANHSAVQTEALIAKNDLQVRSLAGELSPLEKQHADALLSQQAAQAAVDEAIKKLEIAKQSAEQIAQLVSEKKTQLATTKQSIVQSNEQLAAYKAVVGKAMTDLTASESGLTKQKEALMAVEKEIITKQADLAERDQALVTSQKTRDQAANLIPIHQGRIRIRTNLLSESLRLQDQVSRFLDQSNPVRAITFHPDDSAIFVVDSSGRTRRFDTSNGQLTNQWSSSPIQERSTVGFSVNTAGERLMIASPYERPRAIELNLHWQLEQTFGGPTSDLIADRVTALDFRQDGHSLAIGSGVPSRSGQVLIVSTDTGQVLRIYDRVHSDAVFCVCFSPDDRILASGAADKTIRLIDIQTNQVVGALDGHTHHVLSVAWSSDARVIASGGADGTIKIWDAETGQQKRTIGNLRDEITSIGFLGDSARVVSSGADGQIRVHDSGNGSQIHAAAAAGDFFYATAIDRAGTKLYSAGQTGTLHVWQTEGLKPLGQW